MDRSDSSLTHAQKPVLFLTFGIMKDRDIVPYIT